MQPPRSSRAAASGAATSPFTSHRRSDTRLRRERRGGGDDRAHLRSSWRAPARSKSFIRVSTRSGSAPAGTSRRRRCGRRRTRTSRPAHWRYAQAKGALDAAGRLINTELAERRNLILINPLEGNDYATARTLVAAYQMIMPGEHARSHRHTPNALRLVIDAEPGTYTIVNGARLPMAPNDVVLTPNWCWHGHGNDGKGCGYWLDFLDVPLVHLLDPMFFEPHPDEFEDERARGAALAAAFPVARHRTAARRGRARSERAPRHQRRAGRSRARHHGALHDAAGAGRGDDRPTAPPPTRSMPRSRARATTIVEGRELRVAPRRRASWCRLARAFPSRATRARCCSASPTSR